MVDSLYGGAAGPAITADASSTDLGLQFTVTQTVTCTALGFWLPSTGDTTTGNYSARLFTTTNGTTGTLVGSSVTFSSLTAGAWNWANYGPQTLVTGTTYTVVVSYVTGSGSNHYGSTSGYWTTGGAGASGLTSPGGLIHANNNASSLNSVQSPFNEPGSGVFPTSTFNQSSYFVDVQVSAVTVSAPPSQAARPGRTWLRRFSHRQILRGNPVIPAGVANAGVATGTGAAFGAAPPAPSGGNFVPGDAIPGQAVPGRPYVTGLTIQTAAQSYPPVSPAVPGRTWLRRFSHRQVITPPGAAAAAGTAAAGLATGAGAALQPTVAITANAGLATGTGTAQPPTAAAGANAQLATGTGAALAPSVADTASAGLATGTGTALQPAAAITVNAGLATGTGAALAPAAGDGGAAGLATGTGTAQQPTIAVTVNAGLATGTGAALQPSVSTSGSTNAPAQLATGTGAAQPPTPAAAANAGLATGAGVAFAPGHGAGIQLATGTAAAQTAVLAAAALAQAATALAAALGPVPPVPPTIPARSVSTVTDPRDGTDTVTAVATSTPGVT